MDRFLKFVIILFLSLQVILALKMADNYIERETNCESYSNLRRFGKITANVQNYPSFFVSLTTSEVATGFIA